MDGGTDADAGRPRIVWPAPLLTVQEALDPSLVQSPSGERTLVYRKEGRIWAHRNPPEGAPIELAAAGSSNLSVAASPSTDRIFVAWEDSGISLTAGVPDRPPFATYGGLSGLSAPGTGWVDGRPVVSAFVDEVWNGSVRHPASFVAFAVPLDPPGPRPLPDPSPAMVVESPVNSYQHYDEVHRFLDLGGGKALLFRTQWRTDPADPGNGKAFARWHHLVPRTGATGPGANYLVPSRSGLLELPGPAAWIQAHALGGGRQALTWGSTTDALVYDVFVAGLALSVDGTPCSRPRRSTSRGPAA